MSEPTKEKPEIRKAMVPISCIVTDDAVQIRESMSAKTVDEYEAIIREHEFMDPLLLIHTGDPKALLLSKGRHRLEAYRRVGTEKIPCGIIKGTVSDAKWHAFEDGHSCLPLTNADKRKAAKIAVEDPNIGLKTDKDIAKRIGCSTTLVSEVRRGITPEEKAERAEKRKKTPAPPPEVTFTRGREPLAAAEREAPALAPVTTKQRKSEKEQDPAPKVTKPMALRQIDHWINLGLIDEEDVLKKFSSGAGNYYFLPKIGKGIELRVTDDRGRTQIKVETILYKAEFGSMSFKAAEKVKVVE